MGILKRCYLEEAGVFDEPSTECPRCERETESPGDLCFNCQFDEKMDDEEEQVHSNSPIIINHQPKQKGAKMKKRDKLKMLSIVMKFFSVTTYIMSWWGEASKDQTIDREELVQLGSGICDILGLRTDISLKGTQPVLTDKDRKEDW